MVSMAEKCLCKWRIELPLLDAEATRIDHEANGFGAVMRTDDGSETHIDDTGFAHGLCILVDVAYAVEDGGILEGRAYQHDVGRRSHTAVALAEAAGAAAASGDTGGVASVTLIGKVGASTENGLRGSVFGAVGKSLRGCAAVV